MIVSSRVPLELARKHSRKEQGAGKEESSRHQNATLTGDHGGAPSLIPPPRHASLAGLYQVPIHYPHVLFRLFHLDKSTRPTNMQEEVTTQERCRPLPYSTKLFGIRHLSKALAYETAGK